ncbi:unnamed protein product [Natator depressus]
MTAETPEHKDPKGKQLLGEAMTDSGEGGSGEAEKDQLTEEGKIIIYQGERTDSSVPSRCRGSPGKGAFLVPSGRPSSFRGSGNSAAPLLCRLVTMVVVGSHRQLPSVTTRGRCSNEGGIHARHCRTWPPGVTAPTRRHLQGTPVPGQ